MRTVLKVPPKLPPASGRRTGYFTERVRRGYCKDCGNRRTAHMWRCEPCHREYLAYMNARRKRERAEARRLAGTPRRGGSAPTWVGEARRGRQQAKAKSFVAQVERWERCGDDVLGNVARGRKLSRRGKRR